MTIRTAGITATAVVVVALAVALPLFQPWRLFTDTIVDEELPVAAPISTQPSSTTPPTISVAPRPTPNPPPNPTPKSTPPEAPEILLTGRLITHEHSTSGTVAVLKLPDGRRILRIEDLNTSD
ncbi:hypothetical protein [Kribbella sp. NPDC055071]